MDQQRLADLIEGNDLDGLVRFVDGLCTSRDWQGIIELRDRCFHAVERGKQLWGVAYFAEYRLAFEAPGAFAAPVVASEASHHALGPLWEVAASTHDWAELSPHLPNDPAAAMVAHERVIRGEDLSVAQVDPGVVELPLVLQEWEPTYAVAAYRADKADFPEPAATRLAPIELKSTGARVEGSDGEEALYDLARPWAEQSNGHCEAVAVRGSAEAAVRALGPTRVFMASVEATEALAVMAWTGASGGAYGRRRGGPVGRGAAWWAIAAMAETPLRGDAVGEAAERIRWYRWSPEPGPAVGWACHLAAEFEGTAWAMTAIDAV